MLDAKLATAFEPPAKFSLLPAAVVAASQTIAIYSIIYSREKWIEAAGKISTVSEEVLVIVWCANCAAFAGSVFALWAGRGNRPVVRTFVTISLATSACAICFWAWLNLTGTVMSYGAWMRLVKGV
ncbi:MAG: hypothetical protein JSS02_07705 [Planctomycetes bacterium]|nr:hypothetical protein [Planctomycetota bacterium]